jgi:2-hydroxy-3-keto-5-methylthiopentenyl-1-phosphate phosphatase
MQEGLLNCSVEIYCDFDGTITTRDSFDFVLETLALAGWEEIEQKWERDEITSRDCMRLQTELIPRPWSNIETALKEVQFDPSFAPFAQWCLSSGVKLYVVSDGVDRIIKHLLEREGVQVDCVWSNRMVEKATGQFTLEFPYAAGDCPLGICKCALLERAGTEITRVVIGDSKSDFCWSKVADLLFAKKKLLDYCRNEGLAHIEFDDFKTIQKALMDRFVLMRT